MSRGTLIKQFIIFLVISWILATIFQYLGENAQPLAFNIVANKIAKIDQVLANYKWYFKEKQYNKVHIEKKRIPTKIIVQNKWDFIITNRYYWSNKKGLMYLWLQEAMKKNSSNSIPFYQFPEWALKIIHDRIWDLNPAIYTNIWNREKKELQDYLRQIEDYLGKQKMLAILPFISSTAPEIVGLQQWLPAQIWRYNPVDKNWKSIITKSNIDKIWKIYIAFLKNGKNPSDKRYMGAILVCSIQNSWTELVTYCKKTTNNTYFKNNNKVITKKTKDWSKDFIWIYSYQE